MERIPRTATATVFAATLLCYSYAQAAALRVDPTSLSGNVEEVCKFVTQGLSSYGHQFTQYQLPESCRAYRGVGDEALKTMGIQGGSCYSAIASQTCGLQFTEYEAAPSCQKTKKLFYKMIETCSKNGAMGSEYATCASFNHSDQTVLDPEAFCKSSFLRVDRGTNADGKPAVSEVVTFPTSELPDCKRIVENYNACILVGVGVWGHKPHYCTGGGFEAYCYKYPIVIRDATYKKICSELVLPYVMEMNQAHTVARQQDLCDNMYEKYLTYLGAKKGDYLKKARAAKLSLDSVHRSSQMVNTNKGGAVALAQVDAGLSGKVTDLMNRCHTLSEQNMGIDGKLTTALEKLHVSMTYTENAAGSLAIPEEAMGDNTDEGLEALTSIASEINNVASLQQQSLQACTEIEHLLGTTGHVSYDQSNGFYPVPTATVEDIRRLQATTSPKVQQTCAEFETQLLKYGTVAPEDEQQISETGKMFTTLSEVYAAQTATLVKMQRFGRQSGNVVTSAMNSARAEA